VILITTLTARRQRFNATMIRINALLCRCLANAITSSFDVELATAVDKSHSRNLYFKICVRRVISLFHAMSLVQALGAHSVVLLNVLVFDLAVYFHAAIAGFI
jgi:hypothetical protein